MTNESTLIKEIYAIRLKIYEKIKDMPPEELLRYFNESTKETVEKYGIKVGTPADNRA